MKHLQLLLITVLLAGCSGGNGLLTHVNDDGGFTITYPAEWQRADNSLTPVLGYPMLVAIATFDPPVGGETCAHVAANALDAVGPADVLLTVHELPFEAALGPRPDDFRSDAAFWPGGDVVSCMQGNPERLGGGQFRFFEAGRTFDAVLAIGPEATAQDTNAAWAMLDSFRPHRLPNRAEGAGRPGPLWVDSMAAISR